MAYIGEENKYICDFCGRQHIMTSCYGSFGMKEFGWGVKFTSKTYIVKESVFKNWFTYSERLETKVGIELKCDVCIRKEKINRIKDAIHTR
jgi:hypothetical protein